MAEKKVAKKSKEKIDKKNVKAKKGKIPEHKPFEAKIVELHKKQKALAEKKSKLAVKSRQTKWAPVWAVMKKFGKGKRVHPSAITKHRRSWRRTKLHIKPRKIRKWHMG